MALTRCRKSCRCTSLEASAERLKALGREDFRVRFIALVTYLYVYGTFFFPAAFSPTRLSFRFFVNKLRRISLFSGLPSASFSLLARFARSRDDSDLVCPAVICRLTKSAFVEQAGKTYVDRIFGVSSAVCARCTM